MQRKVYFGNDSKQTWIVAPQSGMKASSSGWISDQKLLNGKSFIKRSKGNQRRFSANWIGSLNTSVLEDSLHTIKDFADGIYGDGPFYWNDPYAMKTNMFPPAWASSFLMADNQWGDIFPPMTDVSMTSDSTSGLSGSIGSNLYGFPDNTLRIESGYSGTFESKELTFIIPDGYTLHLALYGSCNDNAAGGAFVTMYNRDNIEQSPFRVQELSLNGGYMSSVSLDGSIISKIKFKLAKTSTGFWQMLIAGMSAKLVPTGVSLETENFFTGRGTTGLEFASLPELDYYSANINNGQVGMSVNWAEI